MIITCIPLDKRPYNYQFLKQISNIDKEIELILPDKQKLGEKKDIANINYLQNFLLENSKKSDALIISIDMLIYGGLFPARIHNNNISTLKNRLNILKFIKQKYPNIKIYISNLILRTPKYNSNEEEPYYYAKYGKHIFLYGYYLDKIKNTIKLSKKEYKTFKLIKNTLPKKYLKDFINRRYINREITTYCLNLCKKNIIDIMIIPQDDSSKYGFTAIDQRFLYKYISQHRLQKKVFLHPGTDESGCTLLTRAYLDKKGSLNIFPIYSTNEFKHFVPNYEDRPFEESFISHTMACNINIVDNLEDADFCIAISGAPGIMQEAFEISHKITINKIKKHSLEKNILYYRNRNLQNFANKIQKILDKNINIGILDVAMSNGGEKELIEILDNNNLIEQISAYSGWNTTCNSLGTILATLSFCHYGNNLEAIENFKLSRIISDWTYQTETRFDIELNYLNLFNATYSNFNNKEKEIFKIIKTKLENNIKKVFKNSYINKNIIISNISAPFNRLSGLEFDIILENK